MCQVNDEDDEAFQALKAAAANKWVRIRMKICLSHQSFLEQRSVENV